MEFRGGFQRGQFIAREGVDQVELAGFESGQDGIVIAHQFEGDGGDGCAGIVPVLVIFLEDDLALVGDRVANITAVGDQGLRNGRPAVAGCRNDVFTQRHQARESQQLVGERELGSQFKFEGLVVDCLDAELVRSDRSAEDIIAVLEEIGADIAIR